MGQVVLGGDVAERVWREQYVALVRSAWLLTGSREDAEDAVHEAWLACASRLSVVERPEAYLRRAVVNACHGRHRRRDVEQRALARFGAPESAMPEHLVDLTDALARLSDRARSVVVLRSYVGLPDDEIGRVLGCTAVTVRVIFHRAMVGLREVIR